MRRCAVKLQTCNFNPRSTDHHLNFRISKYSMISLENEISTQWHAHSRYVRDGIEAVKSTIQLANGCTAIMPVEDADTENDSDYGTECTVSSIVFVIYTHDYV